MSPLRTVVPLAALAVLVLGGCATGERPSFAEAAEVDDGVGDPAVDAVLERLDIAENATGTATYEITNNFGAISRPGTVVQTVDGRRSITVGDVRFLIEGAATATCNLATGACTDTIDDAAVSDMQLTHQFYGRSPATRLRTDAARRVGPTEGYTAEFGGVPATCVGVPVAGGTTVYCATDDGVLANYQGSDAVITLTGWSPAYDEAAAFSRSR
jgi:hypothetical protein